MRYRGTAVWFALGASLLATARGQEHGHVRLELLRTVPVEGGPIMAAAFTPDGAALATGGDLGDLRLFDLTTRMVRWRAEPSDIWIGTLAFSPDGKRLACLGRDLTLHDTASGKELQRVREAGPRAFAWSPDGARFAYALRTKVRVEDGKRVLDVASFEAPVHALTFTADGALFVGDNVGRLWRVPPAGGASELLFDHRQAGHARAWSIAVAWAGGEVFDLPSYGALRRGAETFAVPGMSFALAVTADGSSFAVGGAQASVRWWRERGAQVDDLAVSGKVASLAFHPDGQTLFVATYDGGQALHARGKAPIEVPPHPARVRDLTMSADGTVLAIQGSAWTLQPLDGRPARALPGALAVEVGRRGAELLVQMADRIVVLDARTEVEVASVPSRGEFGVRIAPGPGNLLLVGCDFVDVTTHAAAERDLMLLFLRDVARSHDGRWAAACADWHGGTYGGLLIAERADAPLRVADRNPAYAVAFSPDGRRVWYSGAHGFSFLGPPPNAYLRVRDAGTLALEHQVAVAGPVYGWRFLDDRWALACVGGELQVWDVDRLAAVQTLALDEPCHHFLVSEDRRTVVFATQRAVHVHRVHFE